MDLFVINRDEEGGNAPITEEEERSKLDKVLKKIERRKLMRQRQKDVAMAKTIAIQRTNEKRQRKREAKAKIIPVPENKIDDFIPKDNEDLDKDDDKVVETKKRKRNLAEIESNLEGFTVLGSETASKKQKVKRILPKWLTTPTLISSNLHDLKTKASSIKLLDKTIRNQLKSNGIKYLFPVQAEVIPWLLKVNQSSEVVFPRDICVSAPTGSGKTLAFVLPIIQSLKKHQVRKIRALVILPTQDLAAQVFKTFKLYSQGTKLEVCIITGKNSFEQEQKQLVIESEVFGFLSKADILICTAGRLVNHLKSTKGFNLRNLEFLIIDEADRVLENLQNDWLYHLEKHIEGGNTGKVLNLLTLKGRRPPQKLLFSATLSQDPEKLEKLQLFQPKLFTSVGGAEDDAEIRETFVGKYTTPSELTEKIVVCSKDLKPLVLYKFIELENLTKSIIFTHSVESAHRLTVLLRSMFKQKKIEEISSQLKGSSRDELISKFSKGEIDLLICTDSLARGIDLPNVKCVISYSAPKFVKTYIHRAGRTARAGEFGLVVTLLHKEQLGQFKTLLEQSKKDNVQELVIPEEDLQPLAVKYKKALNNLKIVVNTEDKSSVKKILSLKKKSKRLNN